MLLRLLEGRAEKGHVGLESVFHGIVPLTEPCLGIV